MSVTDLPAVNATLNATSAFLLVLGYFFIRRKQVDRHRFCLQAALTTSALFLVSYLVYHYHAGSKPFPGPGWIRPVYLGLLLSHTVLAAVIVPMVLITFSRALKGSFDRHRRIARWTFPLWLYVSITGVIIYLMLYQIYGP